MLEIARSWVEGWTVSRRTPKPVDTPWGLSIAVGLPTQTVRHVLLDADVETARGLVDSVTEPATWIKAFLEPEVMRPWFRSGWEPDSPGFLMSVDLRPFAVQLPDGYSATVETADGVTCVRILAADGELAAGGQTGRPDAPDAACVFDRISTEKAHQRLGLGTAVMGTLANAAVENGAATGILGATDQGRALYETLGWKVVAPLSGFIHRPGAA